MNSNCNRLPIIMDCVIYKYATAENINDWRLGCGVVLINAFPRAQGLQSEGNDENKVYLLFICVYAELIRGCKSFKTLFGRAKIPAINRCAVGGPKRLDLKNKKF